LLVFDCCFVKSSAISYLHTAPLNVFKCNAFDNFFWSISHGESKKITRDIYGGYSLPRTRTQVSTLDSEISGSQLLVWQLGFLDFTLDRRSRQKQMY
jgi:hypothetical protein